MSTNNQNEATPHQPATGSVTLWLQELRDGESSQARREIWDRYFQRLMALARSRLPRDARTESDEEDVALSAMRSFFRRKDEDEFPELTDRTGLWPLLAQITVFKALRNIKRQRALKRGRSRVAREQDLTRHDEDSMPTLDELVSSNPTPELAAQMKEQADVLLQTLPYDQLKTIALRKLEGYANDEIAEELGIGLRTVERKLALIRSVWTERADQV